MRGITCRSEGRRLNGFTLIEVLVVLIVAALISGILFQALERAYRLQAQFGSEIFKVQQGQMAVDWYRQTLQGLYPDRSDGSNVFLGTDLKIIGLSNNPLSDNYGAPTPIEWQIRYNSQKDVTELIYSERNREAAIFSWKSKEGRFVYFDEKFIAHESWPPALGQYPQLPSQIQLVAVDGSESVSIFASLRGSLTPLPRATDLFGVRP